MARKKMSMERYEEIKRRLELNHSVRQIARALGCTRRTVRQIRDGKYYPPHKKDHSFSPAWSEQINWDFIAQEVRFGTPVKFLWRDHAESLVSYGNFLKQFYRRYPEFKQSKVVTNREFAPGSVCEVDYAGTPIEWFDSEAQKMNNASVFVGALGNSQLIFACAKEDKKTSRFLECHNEMFSFFGGVPAVTVSDCLKQGVVKPHLYDPELNPAYQDLSKHYDTAIVPARPRHPKDKAIVERSVRLLMRYFRYRYRGRLFYSIKEINQALEKVCQRINERIHSRFKVSRLDRWAKVEHEKLRPLPSEAYEIPEWKWAKVHPDSHVSWSGDYYSVPHTLRGKKVLMKKTKNHIEIFDELERVACHSRSRRKEGHYSTDPDHLPANVRAYHEGTPQSVLSQARFIHQDLYQLIYELFEQNTLGYLRRAMGMVRAARKEVQTIGAEKAHPNISEAIAQMRRFNKLKVQSFRATLQGLRQKKQLQVSEKRIHRNPNPLLRYQNCEDEAGNEQLRLVLTDNANQDSENNLNPNHRR